MTICIAALSDSGKGLVVASDRMATSPVAGLTYEWQSDDIKKIIPLPLNGFVMMSGNDSLGLGIIEASLKVLKEKKIERIEDAVEIFRQEYQKSRLNNFVQVVLEPRGFTLANYYEYHTKLAKELRDSIDAQMGQWSGLVDLVVVGQTPGDSFHVYAIGTPGIITNHDATGYICIGSGGPHAMYHIIGAGYKKALDTAAVKTIVEEAKKKSEVAPGVGSMTDCRSVAAK